MLSLNKTAAKTWTNACSAKTWFKQIHQIACIDITYGLLLGLKCLKVTSQQLKETWAKKNLVWNKKVMQVSALLLVYILTKETVYMSDGGSTVAAWVSPHGPK